MRRNVGVANVREDVAVSFGIRGQCDLFGFTHDGSAVEIELKSATGAMSEHQERWRSFCLEWCVKHFVLKAKRHETREETVTRWIQEVTRGLV